MLKALVSVIPVQERYLLIKGDNNAKVSPLDMAAEIGLPEIMLALTNTEGAYKHIVKECGIFKHILYDVSEYESAVAEKTPIFSHIVSYNEEQLFRSDKSRLFFSEPFKTWIEKACANRYWTLAAWQFFWTAFIVLVFVDLYLRWVGMETPLILTGYLMGTSLITILEEISVWITIGQRRLKGIRDFFKGHTPVSTSSTYRLFQVILAVTLIWSKSILKESSTCKSYLIKEQFSAVLNTMFSILSLLYFTQMRMRGGYVLIILGKMVYDTFMFFFVSFAIYMGFSLSFYYVQVPPVGTGVCNGNNMMNDMTDINVNTTSLGGPEFYQSFLFMSLVMVPSDIYFREASVPSNGIVLYILSIIIIGIVMTNLLIALMTQRVQVIYDHKESLFTIEKLSAIVDLDEKYELFKRVGFMKKFWRRYMWRHFRGRHFRHEPTLTKAYVEVVENVIL